MNLTSPDVIITLVLALVCVFFYFRSRARVPEIKEKKKPMEPPGLKFTLLGIVVSIPFTVGIPWGLFHFGYSDFLLRIDGFYYGIFVGIIAIASTHLLKNKYSPKP